MNRKETGHIFIAMLIMMSIIMLSVGILLKTLMKQRHYDILDYEALLNKTSMDAIIKKIVDNYQNSRHGCTQAGLRRCSGFFEGIRYDYAFEELAEDPCVRTIIKQQEYPVLFICIWVHFTASTHIGSRTFQVFSAVPGKPSAVCDGQKHYVSGGVQAYQEIIQ